ncbi:hypothetical protein BV22DRAFT_967818, partial [Leucogyrophana mollusca]
ATRFPDTSNTRYQSHCEAAAELLTYLDLYIELLDSVRLKKDKQNFNHMEENLFKALHDIPTLTELAVLVLYAAAVTHPYMRSVRGPGTENLNILDLGPLHNRVKSHVQKVIDEPAILIGPSASFATGSLDGEEWQNPAAVAAVSRLASRKDGAPGLPHLERVLVSFFSGALETWERFTMEFDEIGSATAAEREATWMPSTNDANEGALGGYRIHAQNKPTSTVHQYNAKAKFQRNDTQAFMDHVLTGDAHNRFIMQSARKQDSSGLERKRKAALVNHDDQVVREKRKKLLEKEVHTAEITARLEAVTLVLEEASIDKLSVPQLNEQLGAFRLYDPTVPKPNSKLVPNKAKKLEAVK